ncbi:uncharacterized protein [Argopecten irradians]|uniref:uncharacterized protein n=1 Tax=Argopecten irradians TaxID=31199 RepID=UPI0037167A22
MRRTVLLLQASLTVSLVLVTYSVVKNHFDAKLSAVLSSNIVTIGTGVKGSDTRQFVRKTCSSNHSYVDFDTSLTQQQLERVDQCIINSINDGNEGLRHAKADRNIRYRSHTYLNNHSFIIEAGGHRGVDVSELNERFHPGVYVVLEPVREFYEILKEKFKDSPNIVVYNFGVDVKSSTFLVNQGNDGISIYKKQKGTVKLQVIAVSEFLQKLKISESRKVDLLTLNCEGCEYAFLDYLISTDYIHLFRNIQFQSHRAPDICHPVKRYCWYQELLSKTHKIVFQHKFWWESWMQK